MSRVRVAGRSDRGAMRGGRWEGPRASPGRHVSSPVSLGASWLRDAGDRAGARCGPAPALRDILAGSSGGGACKAREASRSVARPAGGAARAAPSRALSAGGAREARAAGASVRKVRQASRSVARAAGGAMRAARSLALRAGGRCSTFFPIVRRCSVFLPFFGRFRRFPP